MSNTNDKVKAMLEFYTDNTTKKTTPKKEKFNPEEFFKKYFALFLPEGVDKGKKTIRILPIEGKDVPFEVIEVHDRKKEKGKGFDKYLCLERNFGEPCPFCEARQELYANGENKLAKDYFPRKLFIAKVIDRDAPQEGVKFWRFSKTIFDQLYSIIDTKEIDISDIENGVDLVINLKRDENGAIKVSGIVDKGVSKLSTDPEQVKEWMANKTTWKDVYKKYDYNFLLITVEGGTPVWSKQANEGKGGYVDKRTLEMPNDSSDDHSELTIGGDDTTGDVAGDVADSAKTDDDLPF